MADFQRQAMLQRTILRTVENFRKIGKANLTSSKVQARLSSLENAWSAFSDGHVQLLARVPDPQDQGTIPYFADDHLQTTEEAYFNAKDFLLDALDDLAKLVSPSLPAPEIASATLSRPSVSLAHLPRVPLAPFNGDCNEWESFRDRFKSLIMSNRELTDFMRMHYLVSSLTGPALEALGNISVTAANFATAWRTLTTRFENKRRLIKLHLSNLIDLPAVKRESASELHALIDRASAATTSLTKLDRSSEDLWADMLVHLVSRKLDPVTSKAWSIASSKSDTPQTFAELTEFLSARARALDEISLEPNGTVTSETTPSPRVHAVTIAQFPSRTSVPSESRRTPEDLAKINKPVSQSSCPLCQSRHFLSSCPRYLANSPDKRREIVKRFSRCFNCLSERHSAPNCPSKYKCIVCQQAHHSSLHVEPTSRSVSVESSAPRSSSPQAGCSAVVSLSATTPRRPPSHVLLATVWLRIRASSGRSATVKALLDQGSEATLVTESLAQLLRAKKTRRDVQISAVGGVHVETVRSAVELCVSPVHSTTPSLVTLALVMPSLTSYHAHYTADLSSFSHLDDLPRADPDPSNPEPIQLILGADLYGDVILNGIRKGHQGQPIAQNSIFGWVISGPVPSFLVDSEGGSSSAHSSLSRSSSRTTHGSTSVSSIAFSHHCSSSLESELRRFWEVEELPRYSPLTPLERQCEEHFMTTHSRTQDGRFVVRLPFVHAPPLELGHSRILAERILTSLTRKFPKNPELEREYCEFMREYEALGHMQRVPTETPPSASQVVYIPHHPVYRPGSSTTRLRVVFNASSSTSNGRSLNDHLLAGPKLQTDLPSVILKWRHHRDVYSADVAKMYRQILVDSRDVDFQRVLWLDTVTKLPVDHALLTVTYGMTCAPFLALRVIQRLRELDGSKFPLAVPILRDQIYVDDVLFGGDSVEVVRARRNQVVALLRCGKFELRKWSSNTSELLCDIDPTDHGLACTKSLAADDHVKVLGIGWNPSDDAFRIETNLPASVPNTKRVILSAISKIYDPLGWVTPVTISAKILLQDLWRARVSWDEALPQDLLLRWASVYNGLTALNTFSLPRWTGLDCSSNMVELHGFCDASSHAYAAVVYLKTTSTSGASRVSLLASKSKVAPISPLTIPRLELSAALLLARLIEFIRNSLGDRAHSCFCWSDSTIVLAWLRDHPSRWKTFVAHRVHEISTRAPDASWRYVPSEDNPADCASRGLLGGELGLHSLWWSGPSWLCFPQEQWPSESTTLSIDAVHVEEKITVSSVSVSPEPWDLSARYSSWPKLLRVTGFLFKFIRACRRHQAHSPPQSALGTALSVGDCIAARTFWIRSLQRDCFPSEVEAFRRNRPLSSKSSLSALSPFVDSDGILRVGGRLRHAPLSFSTKHPIILASHPLVRLIIEQAHRRSLHAGLQLTLQTLRQTFWILRARSLVKCVIHSCVVCVREQAAVPSQLMGQLPTPRVSPSAKSFSHCGVDYAGPFQTRASSGRGIASRKSYIALFICLATRAIHLELVPDYSTPAFIRAFHRFCARRGTPCAMYSDNGTTFVGADRELARAHRSTLKNPDFLNKTASDGIAWHFIPPSAPHFGGLWEAGVKSLKYHLKRVVGTRTFTFEEFNTLLCSIECCLNSRPLAPLRDSTDDFDVLTPGHFLTGSPLTVPPQPSVLNLSENRLTRWQLVRSVTEQFWKLWVNDYLNTLQQRSKWRREQTAVKLGQLVLLRSPNLPPCQWDLGRVKAVHPGADGRVRVVTVTTPSTELKRPIVKLCPLPIVHESADSS